MPNTVHCPTCSATLNAPVNSAASGLKAGASSAFGDKTVLRRGHQDWLRRRGRGGTGVRGHTSSISTARSASSGVRKQWRPHATSPASAKMRRYCDLLR